MSRQRLTDILSEIATHSARMDCLERGAHRLHALIRESEADADDGADNARTIAKLERELASVLGRKADLAAQVEALQIRAHNIAARESVTRAVRAKAAPAKPVTPADGKE